VAAQITALGLVFNVLTRRDVRIPRAWWSGWLVLVYVVIGGFLAVAGPTSSR
jgi:Na+/proline symporter